jgi:membrane-bound lytic murein transglycosylase A
VAAPGDAEPISFAQLKGFAADDLSEAFAVFRRSAALIVANAPSQRPAAPPEASLIAAGRAALAHASPELSQGDARSFFLEHFRPFRLAGRGFVTAYFEPEVEARLQPEPDFPVPVLTRPPDLVTLNEAPIRGPKGEILTSARRRADGSYAPYPDRRAIEGDPFFAGGQPIAYVRDRVELFLMQVQGSARLLLPGGRKIALTYDGRNGWPYTSIGRLLIERGHTPPAAMSLAALKQTVRAMGQGAGAPGSLLMQENQSYVFFGVDESAERARGPIGGEGCALTPFRSIAVDRSIWSYGLPFWIEAQVPWRSEKETRLERLMIAQDTGSAIIGPARADLFFGSGESAGVLAGNVRHGAAFTALLPFGGDLPFGGEKQ